MDSASSSSSSRTNHHGHVVLFYQYFLPCSSSSLSSATITHFRQNSSYYLPLLQQHQSDLCQQLGNMKGRILLSTEGINGTLSCSTETEMEEYIERMEGFDLIGELGYPPPPPPPPTATTTVDDTGEGLDTSSTTATRPKAGNGHLFTNIDWKKSTTKSSSSSNTTTTHTQTNNNNNSIDPFPDLKIQIVNEIVNTGGAIHVDDIPLDTGKEISAEEFHAILLDAQQQQQQEEEEECDTNDGDDDTTANNDKARPWKKQKLMKKKEVVLIDVRNTFEHAIGHFIHPTSSSSSLNGVTPQQLDGRSSDDGRNGSCTTTTKAVAAAPTPAINPNTVTFSHFDSTFCSQNSESLKDKKVLMYCTGGIRCVKASAMLKQRGVQDVSHLSGGIHRYLEKYGKDGFYKGKVFVFDQRVALDAGDMMLVKKKKKKKKKKREVDEEEKGSVAAAASSSVDDMSDDCQTHEEQQQQEVKDVVGKCIECNIPHDEISGANLCSVCRDLILICPSCRDKLHEFHCDRHQRWKGAYFTFLERFTMEELEKQKETLQSLHDSSLYLPAKKHKNVRKTLRKQMEKISTRQSDIREGNAVVEPNAKRRCRTCFESEDICDGRCWGFWKHTQSPRQERGTGGNGSALEPIMEVKVGDRVTVGPNWNEIRLGRRGSQQDPIRLGTVVNIKSWASGGDELDCVAVKWDKSLDCGRRRSTSGTTEQQSEIYRWGVVARNGQRMYDVRRIVTGDGDSSAR